MPNPYPSRRGRPRFRRAVLLAFLLAAAGLAGGPADAADVAVAILVNANNPTSSLSTEDVAKLFLKKTTKWPASGEKVMPVDLHEQSAVRESFSKQFHGKGTAAIKAYWQKMIFSGRDVPPPEKTSVADVAAYVRTNAGGVGYVPASYDAGAGVKVLQVTP